MRYLILIAAVISWSAGCTAPDGTGGKEVRTGAEILLAHHLEELEGRRVGLVMNPTARVQGTHMLDTLLAEGVNVTALFAPEHGFRGQASDGEVIRDGVDRETGLPVYSLYGKTKKPTEEMLEQVDLLLFDMQDVGARFYTYNMTLGRVIESASAHGKPVWVLDRPNPAGGEYMAGWMLEEEYRSFVGGYPIPMVHGMTLGELAKMMVGEGWIQTSGEPQLRVVKMEGWERSMKWPDTGLEWFPPSPNLPTFEHAYLYLGTVLFEGTNISEGRGTDHPFLTIGAPRPALSDSVVADLEYQFPSLELQRITFTPRSMPGKAPAPKFEGEVCRGVGIQIRDYDRLDPVRFGLALLEAFMSASSQVEMTDYIYKLAGTDKVEDLKADWKEEIRHFRKQRNPYLLYPSGDQSD